MWSSWLQQQNRDWYCTWTWHNLCQYVTHITFPHNLLSCELQPCAQKRKRIRKKLHMGEQQNFLPIMHLVRLSSRVIWVGNFKLHISNLKQLRSVIYVKSLSKINMPNSIYSLLVYRHIYVTTQDTFWKIHPENYFQI